MRKEKSYLTFKSVWWSNIVIHLATTRWSRRRSLRFITNHIRSCISWRKENVPGKRTRMKIMLMEAKKRVGPHSATRCSNFSTRQTIAFNLTDRSWLERKCRLSWLIVRRRAPRIRHDRSVTRTSEPRRIICVCVVVELKARNQTDWTPKQGPLSKAKRLSHRRVTLTVVRRKFLMIWKMSVWSVTVFKRLSTRNWLCICLSRIELSIWPGIQRHNSKYSQLRLSLRPACRSYWMPVGPLPVKIGKTSSMWVASLLLDNSTGRNSTGSVMKSKTPAAYYNLISASLVTQLRRFQVQIRVK